MSVVQFGYRAVTAVSWCQCVSDSDSGQAGLVAGIGGI